MVDLDESVASAKNVTLPRTFNLRTIHDNNSSRLVIARCLSEVTSNEHVCFCLSLLIAQEDGLSSSGSDRVGDGCKAMSFQLIRDKPVDFPNCGWSSVNKPCVDLDQGGT